MEKSIDKNNNRMGAHSGKANTKFKRHSSPSRRRLSVDDAHLEADASILSEADYKYLIEQTHLSRAEIKSIHNKFVRESVNGDELDLNGFVEFYKSLSTDPPAFLDENAEFIFDTFDKDHNGKVSFREFMCAYVLTTPGHLEKKLEYTFDLYDMDGNGYLDLDEIYRYNKRFLYSTRSI